MSKKIFFITGEVSGDLHAASLLKELFKLINKENLVVKAVGSNHLKDAGAEICFDCKNLASIGLTEVIAKLPMYLNLEKKILKEIKDFTPDIVVLVDFPGFNLRLSKKIKRYSKDSKIVYYLPPQVWAWNQGRTKTLAKYCDMVLCGLPFEEEFHKSRGVNAYYVGSPILHELPRFNRDEIRKELGIKENEKLIGIMPGSRKSEIHFMLEILLKASKLLFKDFPNLRFILSNAQNVGDLSTREEFKNLNGTKERISILSSTNQNNYKLQCASDVLLLTSGTVTLESALYETPLILGYRGNQINYFLYLLLKKVTMVGLPNIIYGEKIVPELIQKECTPESYYKITKEWLTNPEKLKTVKNNLSKLKEKIGSKNASYEVAKKIIEMLN